MVGYRDWAARVSRPDRHARSRPDSPRSSNSSRTSWWLSSSLRVDARRTGHPCARSRRPSAPNRAGVPGRADRRAGERSGALELAEAAESSRRHPHHQRTHREAAHRLPGRRVLPLALHPANSRLLRVHRAEGRQTAALSSTPRTTRCSPRRGLTRTTEIDGQRRRVFVVVTQEARDAAGEVHDRMPVFLSSNLWGTTG